MKTTLDELQTVFVHASEDEIKAVHEQGYSLDDVARKLAAKRLGFKRRDMIRLSPMSACTAGYTWRYATRRNFMRNLAKRGI